MDTTLLDSPAVRLRVDTGRMPTGLLLKVIPNFYLLQVELSCSKKHMTLGEGVEHCDPIMNNSVTVYLH